MSNKVIKIFLCLTFIFQSSALAQTEVATGSFKEKMATIIFCGLGSAVLGLSTLSFYGEPQKHIGNISTGFALGLITGSAFIVYQNTAQYADSSFLMKEIQNKENLLVSGEFSKLNTTPYMMTFQF